MTRCLALGSALTRSSCSWIFGAGPRLLPALAFGASPIKFSINTSSVLGKMGRSNYPFESASRIQHNARSCAGRCRLAQSE